MDWTPWLEQGLVRPAIGGGFHPAIDLVRRAWDRVIAARAAYLVNDWEQTDSELRQAFVVATHVLLTREDFEATAEYDFETMQRMSRDYFDEYIIDSIFERARILSNMLPLDREVPEDTARLIRRSVAASSEFVSLIESHCYTKKDMFADLEV